jgi:cytochrome P450
MPLHTIHRDERYFSLPLTFAPERWTALHHTPASGFDADSGTETRIDPAILESRTYEDMETKNAAWKPLNDSTINTVAQTSIVPKIQPLTSPYTATTSAFMPFGVGAYNCVGQKLARMEIRSVVANVVRSFDIAFADGETGRSMERETIDCFTTCVGTLDVRLTPRRNGE